MFQVLKCILTRYLKSDKCIHIYMQSVQDFFTDLKFKNIVYSFAEILIIL